jgi:hypothetical protein
LHELPNAQLQNILRSIGGLNSGKKSALINRIVNMIVSEIMMKNVENHDKMVYIVAENLKTFRIPQTLQTSAEFCALAPRPAVHNVSIHPPSLRGKSGIHPVYTSNDLNTSVNRAASSQGPFQKSYSVTEGPITNTTSSTQPPITKSSSLPAHAVPPLATLQKPDTNVPQDRILEFGQEDRGFPLPSLYENGYRLGNQEKCPSN